MIFKQANCEGGGKTAQMSLTVVRGGGCDPAQTVTPPPPSQLPDVVNGRRSLLGCTTGGGGAIDTVGELDTSGAKDTLRSRLGQPAA